MQCHRSRKTYTDGKERDSLVDPPQRRDIDGLTTDSSLRTNSGRVLSGSGVDDGVNENLDRVLLGNKVDDLESVLNDSDGHDLFTVVSAVHHETEVSADPLPSLGLNRSE